MVPSIVEDLCERYARNVSNYHSQSYNEAQLRQEFLNPLLKALGWDMENEQGYAEAYKEVVHEDSIRDEDSVKAPDYSFRIGGTRKFFLEAKKPRVFINDDPKPAFQLRRYAWSAKLPLSILTNFEDFSVYDCRWRPAADDNPGKHRILYLKYKDYAARWDEIANVFSRDAILKGSFDKYAQEQKGKRGTQGVDDEFLRDIESFREDLARNIHLRNKELSLPDLNYAVGKIIDRLLFLRVCEDRGIEEYGQIKALLSGIGAYERLLKLFTRADERYNSGLFHFKADKERNEQPDRLTPGLVMDDKILKEIIKRLYYPESPYEFAVMPADILGQVYEQFLGKVIVKAGRTVDVEYKPEVKKAGGVYYTPTYIVDYIVKHTVGKLLEGKTPKEVETLRILDPACGSGSFLIGAYQYLLDWHLEQYLVDSPDNKGLREDNKGPGEGNKGLREDNKGLKPLVVGIERARANKLPVYQSARGEWRLTLDERRRILTNNIYGVDIDAQAVEVTKLSLLLKVLEGESKDTVQGELKLRHHALPDLSKNIKCGNSLIGSDINSVLAAGGNARERSVTRGLSPLLSTPTGSTSPGSTSPASTSLTSMSHGATSVGSTPRRPAPRGTLSEEEWARINPFDWQSEFPHVFNGEPRSFYLVTFVTHNSRVSERMMIAGVERGEPLVFSKEDQKLIASQIAEACREHGIPVVAWNVLPDHVHMVLAAVNDVELTEHVRKIKGGSSFGYQRQQGWKSGQHVWAQKFHSELLSDERAVRGAVEYVWNNRLKHQDRWDKEILDTWSIDEVFAEMDRRSTPDSVASHGVGSPSTHIKGLSGADNKGLKPLVEILLGVCVSVEEASTQAGGFDAVIGNPPYVRQETLGLQFKNYAQAHYEVYNGIADLYTYFVEQSHRLLKEGGRFGMICSNKWMRADYGGPLRGFLATRTLMDEIVDFGELKVFHNAATFPAIVLTRSSNKGLGEGNKGLKPLVAGAGRAPASTQSFVYAAIKRLDFISLDDEVAAIGLKLDNRAIAGYNWALAGSGELDIIEKMKAVGTPLGKYVNQQIYYGIKTGLNEAFVIDGETRKALIKADKKSAELIKPFVVGDDVRKYHIRPFERYVIFTKHGTDIEKYPAIKDHLQRFKKQLMPRPEGVKNEDWPGRKPGPYKWYEIQDNVAYWKLFEKPKIVYPDIAKESRFTFDESGYYFGNTVYFISSTDKHLLGLLNSKLMFKYLKRTTTVLGDADKGGRLRLFRQDVVTVPIRTIDFSDKKDKARHDKMVSLVEKMLEMNQRLPSVKSPVEKEKLERQIATTDRQIDELVYELYGLTEEEIRIVEGKG